MKLKETWDKIAKFIAGTPPVNSMDAYHVQHIREKVRAQTSFDVACMDTRIVNRRKNVGLVMSPDTPAEEVVKAEDVFIAAAMEKGIKLNRDQVLRYVPGSEPTVGRWRPRVQWDVPKTW